MHVPPRHRRKKRSESESLFMNGKKIGLTIETLEDRITPSTGIACPNHKITISLVPDGRVADGYSSSTSQTLGSQTPTQVWQGAVLKAAQDWAAAAGNITITLVPDSGAPLDAPGL